jgi:hypothetical protein
MPRWHVSTTPSPIPLPQVSIFERIFNSALAQLIIDGIIKPCKLAFDLTDPRAARRNGDHYIF